MRDLVYTGFMSLDGVIDSPGGGPGEEHRSGGWVFKDLEFVPDAWSLKGGSPDYGVDQSASKGSTTVPSSKRNDNAPV
jgi:hypothetical protein